MHLSSCFQCRSRPPTCYNSGLESHRWLGYLSVVSVVCCQVEVAATGRSLVQWSPTECDVCVCVFLCV